MIEVVWGAGTHGGRVRRHNEDAVLAAPPVFVVADGMGGHQAGEVASGIAIDHFRALGGRSGIAVPDVAAAISAANEGITTTAGEREGLGGMGTTLVGLVGVEQLGSTYWLAFNVGDSRLYRLWDGGLTQVSVDHSYVQELVTAGELSSADALEHPERNIVTRALGQGPGVEPDFWMLPPQAGERFLLCTDGLSGEVPEGRILELLLAATDPSDAAGDLVAAALSAGGRDNISVIVIDVRGVHDDSAHETTLPRGTVVDG